MTRELCGWCSKLTPVECEGSTPMCEDCFESYMAKMQREDEALDTLAKDAAFEIRLDQAGQAYDRIDRSPGIHAATAYLRQNRPPRPLPTRIPHAGALEGLFWVGAVMLVGLLAVYLAPL